MGGAAAAPAPSSAVLRSIDNFFCTERQAILKAILHFCIHESWGGSPPPVPGYFRRTVFISISTLRNVVK